MVIIAVVLYSKYPPEEKYNSGASEKSVGGPRRCSWWLGLGLLLAAVFMVIGNSALGAQLKLPSTDLSASPPLAIEPSSSPPPQEHEPSDTSNNATTSLAKKHQLDRVLAAQQVVHCVLPIFQKKDVPVTFFAGVALHALCNASRSCFQASALDHDAHQHGWVSSTLGF